MEFIGFHGTDGANEFSILNRNFNVSAKCDEWLGTGAYFFLDGVGKPEEHAEAWAKLQAYDSSIRGNRYSRFVVIGAKITVTNVLRMDTEEGLEAFNVYRSYIKTRMEAERQSPSRSLIVNDCIVFNHILDETEFEAVINCEYIKLDVWSRVMGYGSRIPNCRVMSVKKPTVSIDVNGLHVAKRGKV
ncbi:hypothetical protein [Serratia marcescens]|uniref:hypothetical protein n=1 Tax=Serratia marcescens TaxID=615 RepID=UPI0002AF2E12|nr:hypothetical protein [Serratia marcescens]AGE17754.1 hypothetical protein SMWW4_v1c19530 [Serratia marcescens WW4]MDP8858676.1 hypothetical protein [Serratia marcescens]